MSTTKTYANPLRIVTFNCFKAVRDRPEPFDARPFLVLKLTFKLGSMAGIATEMEAHCAEFRYLNCSLGLSQRIRIYPGEGVIKFMDKAGVWTEKQGRFATQPNGVLFLWFNYNGL